MKQVFHLSKLKVACNILKKAQKLCIEGFKSSIFEKQKIFSNDIYTVGTVAKTNFATNCYLLINYNL